MADEGSYGGMPSPGMIRGQYSDRSEVLERALDHTEVLESFEMGLKGMVRDQKGDWVLPNPIGYQEYDVKKDDGSVERVRVPVYRRFVNDVGVQTLMLYLRSVFTQTLGFTEFNWDEVQQITLENIKLVIDMVTINRHVWEIAPNDRELVVKMTHTAMYALLKQSHEQHLIDLVTHTHQENVVRSHQMNPDGSPVSQGGGWHLFGRR